MKYLFIIFCLIAPDLFAEDQYVVEVLSVYNANQARFHQQYKGRGMQGTGRVEKVVADILGTGSMFSVLLNVNGSIIQCLTENRDEAASLNKGENVHLQGRVYDVFLNILTFDNCAFSDINSVNSEEKSTQYQSSSQSPSQNKPVAQLPKADPDPNPQVENPIVNEGDIYIFESKDPEDTKSTTTTKRTVKSVGATIQLSNININNKNAKTRNLTYDRDWNLISTRNADKSGADYSPPLKYYDFPLKSGNSWNQSSIETDIKSGKKRTHTITGAVDGWENVSVPAGNFRAIKVSLQTEISDPNTGEIIHGTDVSWFVPEIGRSVKSITSSQDGKKRIIQLIGYELADRK